MERQTVCVTGATGFVASHIIDQLLSLNYIVHATVRNVSDTVKYSHLNEMIALKNLPNDSLKFFEATLDKECSFDDAITGCHFVLHTASPYSLDASDPQKDLVDPAVNGTLNVLRSVLKVGSQVKRVVVTSSVAAITDSPETEKVYTESDWNTESSLTRNPYYFSKVEAEKAAWDFVRKNPSFELLVICPSVIIGPELSNGDSVNQSNKMFQQFTDGSFPALVNLGWAFVDVRDVAKSHILAMESPKTFTPGDSKQGRFICYCETKSMEYVCDYMRKMDRIDGKIPSFDLQCGVGNIMMKAASIFQPKGTGQYLRTNLGKLVHCSNQKIIEELAMTFRSVDESMKDTLEDMLNKGHLKSSKPTDLGM